MGVVCVCTENPDVPNSKQGNNFPINVKSLSILYVRMHVQLQPLTVSSLLWSRLSYLFLAENLFLILPFYVIFFV